MGQCPSGVLFKDNCYTLHTTYTTFNNAHKNCQNDGGILAKIDNQETITFLLNTFPGIANTWIGIHDMNRDGVYVNMLNDIQTFLPWQTVPHITWQWDCVYLYVYGKIQGETCTALYQYFCSKATPQGSTSAIDPTTESITDSITTYTTNPITTSDTNPIIASTTNPIVPGSTNTIVAGATNTIATNATNPITTSATDENITSATDQNIISATDPITTSAEDENSATNAITAGATNPITTAATNLISTSASNPITTSATNPLTTRATNENTSATNIFTAGSTNPITNAATNLITTSATDPITTSVTDPITSATDPITTSASDPITTNATDENTSATNAITAGATNPITTSASNYSISYESCQCPCPGTVYLNNTEVLKIKIQILKKQLEVNIVELSSYIRKKNSAPDNRISSIFIGSVFGVLFIISVSLVIILSDLPLLIQQIRNGP
ncbi:uncharacterized protein LOC134236291 [Saccostrea cucullata]|uniref:uncharacterized protein LOC134236291 n=1 Tax=Saccostrea cuccullata TaxID=36930 RepID=UPI002ED528B9